MQAGNLDRRITIERLSVGRDALNNQTESWSPLVSGWPASKMEIRDSERVAAAERGAEVTTRFQIRHSSEVEDVDAKDRIVFDGRTYDIVAVKEIGRREGIEITAAARAD